MIYIKEKQRKKRKSKRKLRQIKCQDPEAVVLQADYQKERCQGKTRRRRSKENGMRKT